MFGLNEPWTRFFGWVIMSWGLLSDIWSMDIPLTFNLVGERVWNQKEKVWCHLSTLTRQVAHIVSTYDPAASRENPYRCRNDVAVAEMTSPIIINNPRPLIWDSDTGLSRGTKLYLVGIQTRGVSEPTGFTAAKAIEVAMGGWRYILNRWASDKKIDYRGKHVLLWRCADTSIRGQSGVMIARAGVVVDGDITREWYAVGFQSHEISPDVFPLIDISTGDSPYWKVALRPPENLMREFWAVVPNGVLRVLDLEVHFQGYCPSEG
jgi:hypothetical protein